MTRAVGIYFDDRGDELFKEVVAQQWRPVMMDEVDEKSFNVRSVLILQKSPNITHKNNNCPISCNGHTVVESDLICHDHEPAVAQAFEWFRVTVVFLVLQTQDFYDVVDLSILHDLQKKQSLKWYRM